MKNNKIYSLISLCARARRLCSGNFSVEKAVKNQSAYVVIVATVSYTHLTLPTILLV